MYFMARNNLLLTPFRVINTLPKVHRRTVFVYIMHEERPLGTPSPSYMRTCAEGYRDFGFAIGTLTEAFNFSQKKVGSRK